MPSLDSPPSSLSLLRRLRSKTSALSLRTPRRQMADFHIELQDPHRVYSLKDVVSGSVCITVERPLAVTHLTASLVGSVDVDVYASSTRDPGAASRKKRRKLEDWGSYGADCDAFNFCRDELVLCGEGRLEPGVYKFGFELWFCKLPGVKGLPTSLDVRSCCTSPVGWLSDGSLTGGDCSLRRDRYHTKSRRHLLGRTPPRPPPPAPPRFRSRTQSTSRNSHHRSHG
jgi:hypothetical protein